MITKLEYPSVFRDTDDDILFLVFSNKPLNAEQVQPYIEQHKENRKQLLIKKNREPNIKGGTVFLQINIKEDDQGAEILEYLQQHFGTD